MGRFCTDDLFLISAHIIPDSPNRQTVTDRILTDDRVEGLRLRRLGINDAYSDRNIRQNPRLLSGRTLIDLQRRKASSIFLGCDGEGLWKRCKTCVFVQNFGFVSQPTVVTRVTSLFQKTRTPNS